MFKVILLAALVSAAWAHGYPKVSYESDIDGDAGLINEDDLRPQYRRQPIYQTQVEYNDEDEQDLVMEEMPILTYDQKTSDSYPKAPSASSGYHKPGKQGTYKGSDITHEIKHKKQSYENTKVSQEHVEVKSVSNEYGTRIPTHGKKEPSKTYKSPKISQEEYKSPADENDYSGHIGQANKAPEFKPTYTPSKKAEAPVSVQQDNVEVDFKSQSPPSSGVKTAYRPPIQPGLSSGMRPGHYYHQGETYNGYSLYNNKKPYENRPPVQTYGVYREGQKIQGAGGASDHSNLGGSGVEYPGIGDTGSVPPPVSSYRPPSPPVSYRPPSPPVSYRPPSPPVSSYRPPSPPVSYRPLAPVSSYRPPSPPVSYRPPAPVSSYRPPSPPVSYRPPAPVSSYRPPSPPVSYRPLAPVSSYRPPSPPVSYRPPTTYSPNNRGYAPPANIGTSYHQTTRTAGHNSGSNRNYNHGGYQNHGYPRPQAPSYPSQPQAPAYPSQPKAPAYPSQPQAPAYPSQPQAPAYPSQPKAPSYPKPYETPSSHSIKSHSVKTPYSGGSSGIKTSGYPASQSGVLSAGKAPVKTAISSGSHYPKPNHPPTKISQEQHSDDHSSTKGGYHHPKPNYPPTKISQEQHSDAYPSVKGGNHHSKANYPQPKPIVQDKEEYPTITEAKPQSSGIGESGYIGKGEPKSDAYKPKYPASHGVKGGSYEPKEYSGVKSASSSGSNPSVSSGYKAPTGHSIKGGSSDFGVKGASYEDKKSPSKYLPITAVSSGSSAPSYKPVESGHNYEQPKVEQAELSYESLLGGHGSRSPGVGSGGYGGLSSGNPSGAAGGSGYGSYEEPSKPMPYEFKYEIKDDEHGSEHYREEKMDDNGYLTGRYGYMDPHGLYRMVEYQADKDGFKVNHVKTNEPGTDNQDPADVHFEVEKHGQY